MREFEESYLKDLQNDYPNVIDESLGKWLKNTFTKFGKDSIQAELHKTLMNVLKHYKFDNIRDESGSLNENMFGKWQGNIVIAILIDDESFKKSNITVRLFDAKTGRIIKNSVITMKHSWTEDELVDAMNKAFGKFTLQKGGKPVPDDFFSGDSNENSTDAGSEDDEEDDQEYYRKNLLEDFEDLDGAFGFTIDEIEEKFAEFNPKKLKRAFARIRSAWGKTNDKVKKLFEKLAE